MDADSGVNGGVDDVCLCAGWGTMSGLGAFPVPEKRVGVRPGAGRCSLGGWTQTAASTEASTEASTWAAGSGGEGVLGEVGAGRFGNGEEGGSVHEIKGGFVEFVVD